MVVAFARASSIKVEIYWHKKGLHHLYHFKVRTCFFRSFTHSSHAKQLTFHHVPRKQRPKSNRNISNHCTAIFHVLELYSSNQISFCQIRLRSNACHFLVNNLHLITYSYRIVQPHWKKLHMELKATDYDIFHIQFFRVLTFSTY